MRTIILSEEALREAIELHVAGDARDLLIGRIKAAIRESTEDLCRDKQEDIREDLIDRIDTVFDTEPIDADELLDTIINQAQRVGTVTDLI